jgi:type IV pilus assembly protein PilM
MPIVGLNLGAHSIRAAELEESRGKITLRNYGSYKNPKLNLDSQSQDELKTYSAAIKDFFSQTGFTTPNTIVAIPESEVFTRVIKVPRMSDKELASSIEYEAEQYIPLSLKEVSFDFQIIDTDILDKDKMNVLLVAAKHTVLEKYVDIVKNAGLVPKGMEPETLAVTRVLGDSEERPSASVIVNFNTHSTGIIISYRGNVRFTRSVSIGGEALTRAVAQSLNLEFVQAEEYKETYGLDSAQADGRVYNAMKPVFDNILSEIKRSTVFYTTHNPSVIINRVILSGGTALMPGLLFYVANNLDMEVELANPWRNVLFSPKLVSQKEALMDSAPLYVTSVGLALKGILG